MERVPDVAVTDLHLDLENPRLPDTVRGASEVEVLRHLYRTAALEELAESIRVNGYFQTEPLLVSVADDAGQRIVLEGNRRLATILILIQDERAVEADIRFTEAAEAELIESLRFLPALETDPNDEDFQAFLGYRHISGLRMWGAGEKARFIWGEVHRLEPKHGSEVFYALGRTVGSNSRGIRSAYIAYELLEHAKREGVDPDLVTVVLTSRFGVWVRLLGTKNAGSYIELRSGALTFDEVSEAIRGVNLAHLEQVLRDLVPPPGRSAALISDSRQVTAYSDVLGLPAARELMWRSGDLDVGVAVARKPEVNAQLQRVADQLKLLTELVSDGAIVDVETTVLADRVLKSSRVLAVTVSEFVEQER